MTEHCEKRQELRRLFPRQVVALMLYFLRLYYERQAGFCSSDPNPGAKTKTGGHVAFACASEFNTLAGLCFVLAIIRITITTLVVVGRLRRTRESCDAYLLIGSICFLISLSFSAYLRWFVVG